MKKPTYKELDIKLKDYPEIIKKQLKKAEKFLIQHYSKHKAKNL